MLVICWRNLEIGELGWDARNCVLWFVSGWGCDGFGFSGLSPSPKPSTAGKFPSNLTSDNAPRHVLVPSESMRGLYIEFISSAVFVSWGIRMHFGLILVTPVILKPVDERAYVDLLDGEAIKSVIIL